MTFDEWKNARHMNGIYWGDLKAAWDDSAKVEREACASAVEAEALECPTDSAGDEAYDNAIRHAAAAIRMRSNDQT